MARGAEEEEEEVRLLLSRHRGRIILDLKERDLVAVLVKNSVISASEEDLLKSVCSEKGKDESCKGDSQVDASFGEEGSDVKCESSEANEDYDSEVKCSRLIELIAKSGFDKFKQFCYAIENECPQLIEDLINDRLKYDTTSCINNVPTEVVKDAEITADSEDINDRSHRSMSYSGSVNITPPVAAPRKGVKSISPIPTNTGIQSPALPEIPNAKSQPDQVNLNEKTDVTSKFQVPATNNYSLLLCHNTAASSPPIPVKKRDKILHRFSDAATIGRKLKKKKNTNRGCRSMAEPIEVLADPVVEDDFFTDRTSWEYHTVAITRVPGYGFGIAVSGGRDNPHFANGDPSIAVSDVLKGGPAEERLQVNDRIISVNGVSLENVEYATAVQVLRDSGNTVTLVVKRRVPNLNLTSNQHSHNMSTVGLQSSGGINAAVPPAVTPGQQIKVALTKAGKKEDFGIVLGCRLFIKEINSKARDQLAASGYSLQEGDIITRLNNTNCNDAMSMKEAKKIIDGCKERLNLVVLRDVTNQNLSNNNLNNSGHQPILYAHTQQMSGCSNNLDEAYLSNNGQGYSSQNLYVQPPTRGITSTIADEKNNLTPRGRSRGPLTDVSLSQLDRPSTPSLVNSPRRQPNVDDPPRPPPPRNEEFYSSRRQLYEDDPLQRSRQSAEPRFISFQKEGSVGIRLTGGNEAGIFVTAVQPGSPASLQGLTPGDKILKVNDMDMHGVTREEAVLFLLSLQDRIDLIVQHCKDEYDEVVANQRGDSFHIKTHFHCENPSKGEMSFKAGDVFRVIDTLHNGVVGSWQVLKIGRGHQEMQRGVIPNKSRAEELATAQFNATKKEMNASESRGNFFRRRRSTHRRSKSLSRENWDDVVFSDSISKFAAYERVVLRHPGFVRPVVIFGPVADLAREKLAKDFLDKFTAPLQDDDKTNAKCRIVRLSNIRDIMDRGKHALLDITPNAVDRLNYAQFYPIVIFLKTDSKHVIKQLRRDVPKSAHKSSKKLLEQCGKLDKVWSHIFSTTIVLNETDSWYRKLRETIDMQQSGAVWMSESKPVESLSDDFLFPMTTSRLSYASSPESDLELSPGPSTSLSLGNLPQLVKSSSDPSIATNQDNLDRDRDIGEGLPPYAHPYNHSNVMTSNHRMPTDGKFGFTANANQNQSTPENTVNRSQAIYGINAPDLPPRIDRASKPPGGVAIMSAAVNNQMRNNSSSGTLGRSAQERLFGKQVGGIDDVHEDLTTRASNTDSIERNAQNSLDRQQRLTSVAGSCSKSVAVAPQPLQNGSYDSVSSYDSYNTTQMATQNIRLGPNAPDDLKSVPSVSSRIPPTMGSGDFRDPNRNASHDHPRNMSEHLSRGMASGGANDLNRQSSPGRSLYDINSPRNIDSRNPHDMRGANISQRPSNIGLESSPRKQIVETKTDYGKYSRNNSSSQADYIKTPKSPHLGGSTVAANSSMSSNVPFKPVPPPKPKNYRPPIQGHMNTSAHWDNGEPTSPRSPNGFFYPPNSSHYHHSQGAPGSPHNPSAPTHPGHGYGQYGSSQQPPYPTSNGYNAGAHPYSAGPTSGGPYMHRNHHAMANVPPHHTPERHALDLAGSREQRGSAFELYRKPQIGTTGHHHNLSDMEPYDRYYHSDQSYNHREYEQYPSQAIFYSNSNACNVKYNYYFEDEQQPPPLPPPLRPPLKTKKKSMLKSPLAAIKNAFMKSTRPLRRMNSMVEPERKIKPCLRRQYSLMERPSRVHYALDNYNYTSISSDQRHGALVHHEPFYPQHLNMTYQNLEHEDIYTSRDNKESFDDLYANRALIDLERRQAESNAGGRRIFRRHSMADRTNQRQNYPAPEESNGVYQSQQGSYLMQERRAPGSAVMLRRKFYTDNTDEPVYQSRREMHRHHLYQSRKEMQERIAQGKKEIEREFTPQSSSNHSTETEDRSDREAIYLSRREMKDNCYKTRAQLREQIYQSRRDAMKSMAEPIYVSRRELKHEPILESKEEGAMALVSKNDTDEKKGKESRFESSIEDTLTTSNNSDLQRSNETVIENERFNESVSAFVVNTASTTMTDGSEARAESTPSSDAPSTPRSLRTPFHLSNIIKRTAPVPPIASSRTSLETHYTSQASLPVGPPNASSTPFSSEMSLPGGGAQSQRPSISQAMPPKTPHGPSTTRGEFDESGGTLFDNVWNVSLSIPPGAIPAGVKQEVYFTVSDPRLSEAVGGPPLDMENGEMMLSPLVMCGPQGLEFLVPVTLNIPHCAGRTASLGLALKATDSEKQLQTNWDNIDLPSNTAAHTVSVKVDHF